MVWNQPAKTVAAGATNSLGYSLVGENFAPGWDNTKGGTIFQQEYTAHPSINATIEANDGLANAVITDLKAAGVKPNKVPTTGQDATAQGMAWILEGYQCGSVYKAVYKEAQDAVAMATILLAGDTPPAALLNGTTVDPANSSITEPASLLTPVWVTKANMESTVVKDGFDTGLGHLRDRGCERSAPQTGSRDHLTRGTSTGFSSTLLPSRVGGPASRAGPPTRLMRWLCPPRTSGRGGKGGARLCSEGAGIPERREPNLGKATDRYSK